MTIITIANQKGGVGKTTTAINLYHALGADYIVEKDLGTEVSELNYARDIFGYDKRNVLTPKTDADLLEILSLSNSGETIIVDTGGTDNEHIQFFLEHSDVILTPVIHKTLDLNKLVDFNTTLRNLSNKVGRKITAYTFPCKVKAQSTLKGSTAFRKIIDEVVEPCSNLELLDTVIFESADVEKATSRGLALGELKATMGSVVKRQYDNLAVECLDLF